MFVRPIVSSYFSALSEAIALPLPMLRWVRSGLRWLADPSPECGPQTSFVYCVLKMKRAAPAPLPDLRGAPPPPLPRLYPPLPELHGTPSLPVFHDAQDHGALISGKVWHVGFNTPSIHRGGTGDGDVSYM